MSKHFARGARAWGLRMALAGGLTAVAAAQDVGVMGPDLGGSGPTIGNPSVTESKPQSKVWFHDGQWWGSLWSSSALEFRIHRLDATTDTWVDTGVTVDVGPDSHSDALAAGNKLYIGTHEFSEGAGHLGNPMYFTSYSYDGASYSIDAGFPVQVSNMSTETMVIARDSTNTLWAFWMFGLRVHFSRTQGSHSSWTTPAVLSVSTTDVDSDDICGVVAFGGNKLGVMWSDQLSGNFLFTTHVDGQADTAWSFPEVLLAGQANDMINLKADATGRVFAMLATSTGDAKLLVRDSGGTWTEHAVGGPGDNLTRPIVLLDEQSRLVHVFAQVGSSIRQKTTSLDAIAFPAGQGTIVIRDADASVVNPTAHKKSVDSRTGILVLAANNFTTGHYWHHQVDGVPGGFVLEGPMPAQAGVVNQFQVSGAVPNAFVIFLVAVQPGSFTVPLPMCPGGLPTNLSSGAIRFGLLRADGVGNASLNVGIPPSVAGLFWFSAVQLAGCQATPAVEATF